MIQSLSCYVTMIMTKLNQEVGQVRQKGQCKKQVDDENYKTDERREDCVSRLGEGGDA